MFELFIIKPLALFVKGILAVAKVFAICVLPPEPSSLNWPVVPIIAISAISCLGGYMLGCALSTSSSYPCINPVVEYTNISDYIRTVDILNGISIQLQDLQATVGVVSESLHSYLNDSGELPVRYTDEDTWKTYKGVQDALEEIGGALENISLTSDAVYDQEEKLDEVDFAKGLPPRK